MRVDAPLDAFLRAFRSSAQACGAPPESLFSTSPSAHTHTHCKTLRRKSVPQIVEFKAPRNRRNSSQPAAYF